MSWLGGFAHRIRVRLRPGAYARERDEEARFHETMEAAHPRRGDGSAGGGPPDPADLTPTQDKLPWVRAFADRLRQDLGYAIRGLIRTPGFTATVLLTLALGVGANAAVFSVLDRVFGQVPASVQNPDGLRRLYIHAPAHTTDRGNPLVFPVFNYPAFATVRDAAAGVAQIAAWTASDQETVRNGSRELSVRLSYVTPDYFRVLGVRVAHGRFFTQDERRIDVPARVAVISHALWERGFGLDPSVLGRTLEMDSTTYTIVGVTSDLLRQVPGVYLVMQGVTGYVPQTRMLASLRPGRWQGGCTMKVIVDGVDFPLDMGFTLDDVVAAQDVSAVEVYPHHGIGAPIQYRGLDSWCGIVMVWTK